MAKYGWVEIGHKIKWMKVLEWVRSESAMYHRVRSEVLAEGYQVSLVELEA